MSREIKKQLSLLKLFILSLVSFVFSSCEDIKLNGLKDGDDTSSCSTSGHCKLFITATAYDGNLGGPSGADSKCMNDSNYPGSGTYKAMVITSSRVSNPGSQNDWVLKASTEYRRLDETIIATTVPNATFDTYGTMVNSFSDLAVSSTWTGAEYGWRTGRDNCLNWTSNSGDQMGNTGYPTNNNSQAWDYSIYSCDEVKNIVCIQQ